MAEVTKSTCPVCATAEIVCGKWTILIIRDLAAGRSESVRGLMPCSERSSSQKRLRLKALEEEGVVARKTYPEVPPRVEYVLTPKGRALLPLIEDMRAFGRDWLGMDGDVAGCAPVPAAA